MGYIKNVFREMKQVTWPTLKEVNNFTWIAILLIVFFGTYFVLTDFAFSNLLDWIVKL
ncbi:preprotein translocase subunit SecE [Eremococcus coleocola]|uniref:Preprotein translocase, SecE subunit n=1 Tax=Eremococcus coleocola ACS-139-V-Col8 TaxID=908337 RepID=E4KNN4_9LACT|nr:preprotein translocase subunit SecE [Eremococcus coleocola]EFR31462.1 preprotein translocase, SecE subunit [Eremococcus coleocola ACS-139-V-Col8]